MFSTTERGCSSRPINSVSSCLLLSLLLRSRQMILFQSAEWQLSLKKKLRVCLSYFSLSKEQGILLSHAWQAVNFTSFSESVKFQMGELILPTSLPQREGKLASWVVNFLWIMQLAFLEPTLKLFSVHWLIMIGNRLIPTDNPWTTHLDLIHSVYLMPLAL